MDETETEIKPAVVNVPRLSLPWYRKLSYGLGHFHNDMCASMWFTYLLVFTTRVLGFSSPRAGNLVLIGQLTDAVCTPLVGLESDRTNVHRYCLKYGRRKTWHFVGAVAVTFSFSFMFINCFGCVIGLTKEWVQLVYYIPVVVIFQFGWACMQIAHLALIPELSSCQHERSTLNGVRYAFTIVANMVVFALMYAFLGLDISHKDVTVHDAPGFQNVALIVTGIGCVFTLGFHIGTKEPPVIALLEPSIDTSLVVPSNDSNDSLVASSNDRRIRRLMTWREWLRDVDFYAVGVLYMATRIFGNITQAYLPLYILETQHFDKVYIAVVPMVVYVSSFVTSSVLSFQIISRFFGRKVILLFGLASGAGTCVWMWFHHLHDQVYGLAVLLGISSTILLVTTLALIADLINESTESSAFVYGAMSFSDKISSGVAIQIIQQLQPVCSAEFVCISLDYYFRSVMVIVPGAALFISFCALVVLWPRHIGERDYSSPNTSSSVQNSDEDPLIS